jgi:hypothetical protein
MSEVPLYSTVVVPSAILASDSIQMEIGGACVFKRCLVYSKVAPVGGTCEPPEPEGTPVCVFYITYRTRPV